MREKFTRGLTREKLPHRLLSHGRSFHVSSPSLALPCTSLHGALFSGTPRAVHVLPVTARGILRIVPIRFVVHADDGQAACWDARARSARPARDAVGRCNTAQMKSAASRRRSRS